MKVGAAGRDTPMVDAPPVASSKPTTDRNQVEHESQRTPSWGTLKRKLSTESPLASQQDATPPESSRDKSPTQATDSRGESSALSAPNKKMRTVTEGRGLDAGPSSSRNQTGSEPSPISSQNELSSRARSKQRAGGSLTMPAASTQPIANGATRKKPQRTRGVFTPEEHKAVEDFKAEFCSSRGISSEMFNELIQHCARDKVNFPMPEGTMDKQAFWNYIYDVLPRRKNVSVARFMRRHFQTPHKKTQQWSAEQDEELARLFKLLGPKWTEIADILGRTSDDVTQRWKNRVEHRDMQREGPWSLEECEELEQSLEKCRTSLLDAGSDVASDIFHLDEAQIGWGRVSDMMGNKRSRQQCADKWRRIRRSHLKGRADRDSNGTCRKSGRVFTTKTRQTLGPSTAGPSTAGPRMASRPTGKSIGGRPAQQMTLSSFWGKGVGATGGGQASSDLGSGELEEDSDGGIYERSVADDNSMQDSSESELEEEGTAIPSTASATGSIERHPGVASPILGSLQDEDRDQGMTGGDDGAAAAASITSNPDDEISLEAGMEGRDQSPEIAESPAPQSEQEEEMQSENSDDDDGSSGLETAESVGSPRLESPFLLGEFQNDIESSLGSSSSGIDSDNESGPDKVIAGEFISRPEQPVKVLTTSRNTEDGAEFPATSRDAARFGAESNGLNNKLAVGRSANRNPATDGSQNEVRIANSNEGGRGREIKRDSNIQVIVKAMPSVTKLGTGVESPLFSDSQAPRDRMNGQTTSTPGRASLSNLRQRYRLRPRGVTQEHTPKLDLTGKRLDNGGSFEGESTSSESESVSDSSSNDYRGTSSKPATHDPEHVASPHAKISDTVSDTAASRSRNLRGHTTPTLASNSAFRDGWIRDRPRPQVRVDKEKAMSTLKSVPLQKNISRNALRNGNNNRGSELSNYLETAKINGIGGQNENSYDDSSTDSETGDIPFSYDWSKASV